MPFPRPDPDAPDASDVEEPPAPLTLGPLFWLLIGFGGLCASAGLIVGREGPRLFPVKPPIAASPRTLGKPAPPR